jgi:hypothetical protein
MKNVLSEALLTMSSFATFLMLCCAIVIYADLWNLAMHEACETQAKCCSLFRSGWFFYGNAAVCLTSVFMLFWMQ